MKKRQNFGSLYIKSKIHHSISLTTVCVGGGIPESDSKIAPPPRYA